MFRSYPSIPKDLNMVGDCLERMDEMKESLQEAHKKIESLENEIDNLRQSMDDTSHSVREMNTFLNSNGSLPQIWKKNETEGNGEPFINFNQEFEL